MSGFIDPEEPTRGKVDGLDAVVDLLLRYYVDWSALDPEVQRVLADLRSDDPAVVHRAAAEVRRQMDEDPLPAPDHPTSEEKRDYPGVRWVAEG